MSWRGLVGGVCPVRSKGRSGVAHATAEDSGSKTYAFFAQLNMISGVLRGVIKRDVIS